MTGHQVERKVQAKQQAMPELRRIQTPQTPNQEVDPQFLKSLSPQQFMEHEAVIDKLLVSSQGFKN